MFETYIWIVVRYLGIINIIPYKILNKIVSFNAWKDLQDYMEILIYKELKYNQDVFNMNNNNKSINKKLINDNCIILNLVLCHKQNPTIISSKNSCNS